MSKYCRTDDFYLDTGLLRDHVSKLREQKKIASRLYATVSAMRNSSPPSEAYRYNSLLRDIEQLIAYFDKMADVLSNASDEAVYLKHKLSMIIEDDTYHARSVVRKSLML